MKKGLEIGLVVLFVASFLCVAFSLFNVIKSKQNLYHAQELLDSRPLSPGIIVVPDKVEYLPKGEVIEYENFRGHKVPILANGKGGRVRWVADVPWDKFSIEEKFDMTRVNGGYLSSKDLSEIWFRFGEWRKGGKFYGIRIYKEE